MTPRLYLPNDEVTGRKIDFDLAADFLELSAFFSAGAVPTSHLANEASIGAAEDHADLDDEMRHGGEEIVSGAVERMATRRRIGCPDSCSPPRRSPPAATGGRSL